ncbi:hypothetical protein ACS0TY_027390 [Phlomoides rotata]
MIIEDERVLDAPIEVAQEVPRILNLLKMNRSDFKILWASLDKLEMQRLIMRSAMH